ncbi:hypothetical protein MRX96_015997 [Rhipicephalus microplus]
MQNDKSCTLLDPIEISGLSRCSRGSWCPCCGSSCGFSQCALQPSIPFPKVSLDESAPTLVCVPGKYPCLMMPSETLSDLTFDMQVFKTGVKNISVVERKQRTLLDRETKAVQLVVIQTILTKDQHCALGEAGHRWSRPVRHASAEVSQHNDIETQPGASTGTVNAAGQHHWAACQPSSPPHSSGICRLNPQYPA